MSYAAGVSGAKASTVYPCGHMAYYDSGSAPPIICPICGERHQNAQMNAQMMASSSSVYPSPGGGYARIDVPFSSSHTHSSASSANVNIFAQQAMLGSPGVAHAPAEWAEELKYPELAWLDREISRYTKS